MKVALAQIDCQPADVLANTLKITSLIAKASQQGCRIVLFPELSDTAYGKSCVKNSATSWNEEGSFFEKVSDAAKKHSIFVICGLSEKVEKNIYNSLAVISPSGELVTSYRKKNLFTPSGEHEYTKAGEAIVCTNIENVVFGLSICYDLRFSEIYLEQVKNQATILINVAAWPLKRINHWQSLLKARAIEGQSFVLGVNRVGKDDDLSFGGNSLIIEPDGTVLLAASLDSEELLVAELTLAKVEQFRSNIPAVVSRLL